MKPKLYLLVGYPGAGKTTVSKIIAGTTGAVHLWADRERQQMFGQSTHSQQESMQLYDALNAKTEQLLAAGKSVVFDTNFNFRADRQKLRGIAERQGAEAVVVWITLPKDIAEARAVNSAASRNGYPANMSEQQFDTIVAKLELPAEDEKVIKIDGAKLDPQTVIDLLQ